MKPGTKVALLVVALFALMGGAWMTLFYVAARARVETVPLVGPSGGPGGPALPKTPEAR
ncbi:MAG: hypothetical protein H7067_03180 [Burkholderiales bacterium]|nr:hypothetical protein [Opitutaceae bacterium]